MLSNEFNIVVCTIFFKQKNIIFCEFSLFTILEISHAWRGGWGLILFFGRYKQSLFEIRVFICSPLWGASFTHLIFVCNHKFKKLTEIVRYAFFVAGFEMSKILMVQSLEPDTNICSLGWNSKQVTSSI